MIVLDEQLLSYGLRTPIAHWYRGTVTAITHLRPGTVIRDDAIPMLLQASRRPTFVTINVLDFWRRLAPEARFCIVCVAVPHTRALEVPDLVAPSLCPGALSNPAAAARQNCSCESAAGAVLHHGEVHDPSPRLATGTTLRSRMRGCASSLRIHTWFRLRRMTLMMGMGYNCSRIQEEAWIVGGACRHVEQCVWIF